MIDDAELLRRYSGAGSEAAFTELVGRHISLVYFTALRRTGDSALAHDIAQSVFSTAARKSAGLAGHPSVTGWLYTTTRHLADKAVRKEQTRRRYEQDAAMHELTAAEPSCEWERLRPIIDDVLDGLDERDREAILIRFFEGRPFADIGATLRISQDAARMRVDRALEKLRTKLEKRGIQSASAALAVALSTQTGMAVPAGMIAAVSGVAMATTAAPGGAAVLLGFMSTTKTTVVAATLATILASGFGIAERNRAQGAETRFAAINQEQISLRTRLAQAEKQLSQADTRAAEVERDRDSLLAAVEAARAEQVASSRSAVRAAAQRPSPVNDLQSAISGIVRSHDKTSADFATVRNALKQNVVSPAEKVPDFIATDMARIAIEGVLDDQSTTAAQKEKRLADMALDKSLMTFVGPKGITQAEGAAAKLTPADVDRLNKRNSIGIADEEVVNDAIKAVGKGK